MRALEQSVREGRIQALASLLEPRLVAAASAPLPGTADKSTLLHLACQVGNMACAQLIVEWAPQSQHARTRSGCTPLLLCCAHGQGQAHCEGVRLLARAGTAPLDARRKDGAGAAHLCAAAGCAQCLQLLLTKAPQLIDARDRQYRSVPLTPTPTPIPTPTPTCLAQPNRWPDLDSGPRRNPRQVLHVAAACRRPDAPACVRLLLREGAQIEACTSAVAGMVRPLQLACLGGRAASVALLLEFGADPVARDAHRRTALHAACAAARPRVVATLLRGGAPPHVLDAHGLSPLHAVLSPLLPPAAAAAASAAATLEARAAAPSACCARCGGRECAWSGVAQRAEACSLRLFFPHLHPSPAPPALHPQPCTPSPAPQPEVS